jgi:hypothetical protein
MTTRKKSIYSILLTLGLIASSGVYVAPIAQAADATTVIISPDGFDNISYVFTIKHPSDVTCEWGTGNPEYGSSCSFDITYSINWVENLTTGYGTKNGVLEAGRTPYKPYSEYLSPSRNGLRVLSDGVDVIDGWSVMSMYGNRNVEQTMKISIKFTGPTTLTFSLKDYILPDYNKQISVSGSGVRINGLSKADAISAYKSAQAKASADAKAEADAKIASEKAALAKKLLSITCKSGSKSKIVRGENPTCPKGYKNPMASYLTFQAFQKCKLFKKDSLLVNASLLDNGKTLDFNSVGKYPYFNQYNFATYEDLVCALGVMKTPSFVTSQINSTRALDGIQKATWGNISAFWTYHPDNGVNITFNQS